MAKHKILIIEDEQFLVDMYKMKFEKEGYEVVVAYDGESGINLAETKYPDVVLLDIVMPKLDGYQVLRRLRENPKTAKLKIYILSNLGQTEEINKGMAIGADGYLIKANLTPSELMDYVYRVLNNGKKNPNSKKESKQIKRVENIPKGEGKKILLIEDEDTIIEMYKLRLEKEGYNVEVAKNGAWGLKMAKQNSYNAIVMDIVMPAMDGHKMLEQIKKDSKNKKAPVLVLSNSGQEQDIDKAKKCGATCYLLKASITPARLVSELEKTIK